MNYYDFDDIKKLRDEAAEAGDIDQVEICDRALGGDRAAQKECERVLENAIVYE